jgi:hypothetical protein
LGEGAGHDKEHVAGLVLFHAPVLLG